MNYTQKIFFQTT